MADGKKAKAKNKDDGVDLSTLGKAAVVTAISAGVVYGLTQALKKVNVNEKPETSQSKAPSKNGKPGAQKLPQAKPSQNGAPRTPSRSSSSSCSSSSKSSSSSSLPQQGRKGGNISTTPSAAGSCPMKSLDDLEKIVISLSSTQNQAGGLMLLPRTKSIIFYSINWGKYFQLPNDSVKRELLNAGFALELFATELRDYKRQPKDSILVKTNGDLSKRQVGEYSTYLKALTDKLAGKAFGGGSWKPVLGDTDPHVKITDRLCEKDWSTTTKLPRTTPDHEYLRNPDGSYKLRNISRSDLSAIHAFAIHASFLTQIP